MRGKAIFHDVGHDTGHFVITGHDGRDSRGSFVHLAKCNLCGKAIRALAYNLSHQKSCGCTRRTNAELGKRHLALDETVFEDAEHVEEAAYWTGFLMADGCVHHAEGGKAYITLSLQARDRKHVEKFREFLKSGHKLGRIIVNGRSYYRVGLRSDKIAADLAKYGVVPRKSLTAKALLLENNKHFWRGALDGDGTVILPTKSRHRPILSLVGSRNLVSQFADYVSRFLGVTIPIYPRLSIWRVDVRGHKACALAEHFYADCSIALDRKFAMLPLFMAWHSRIIKPGRRVWTPEKLAVLSEIYPSRGSVVAAKMLGVTGMAVLHKASHLNLKYIGPRYWQAIKGF
jgi:hypothetical protein